MDRLKNYHQNKRVYRAYLDPRYLVAPVPSDEHVDLTAHNLSHFLQRLAAHLPTEEPTRIVIEYRGKKNER